MEIIKKGIVPKKEIPKLRGICPNCGCLVQCLPTDEAILPYSRSDPGFKVQCPMDNCNYIFELKAFVTRTVQEPTYLLP